MKSQSLPGLCLELEMPPSVFFPDEDHLGNIAYAKTICRSCPVKQECLDGAQERFEEFGIWGGLTPKERKMLRVREALNIYGSPYNKGHEQEHPKNASLSFPSHISDEESHNLQVLSTGFAHQLASRIGNIELSMLQSPEEFPLGPNQKNLVSRVLVEYESFRKSRNLLSESVEESLTKLDHELHQIQGPSDADLIQIQLDPIQFDDLDQSREIS